MITVQQKPSLDIFYSHFKSAGRNFIKKQEKEKNPIKI